MLTHHEMKSNLFLQTAMFLLKWLLQCAAESLKELNKNKCGFK